MGESSRIKSKIFFRILWVVEHCNLLKIVLEIKKEPHLKSGLLFLIMSGSDLLSHKVPLAVPLTMRGLASGFGMGPGVSLSLWPPKLFRV